MVVQWLRICLPIQVTHVQSLVWEDSTSFSGPLSPCTATTEPMGPRACAPQQESSPYSPQLEKACAQQ